MASEPSYFDLFDLKERLELDREELEARYLALARAHHPDRFAAQGPEAQALAAERMERVNRAYRTLKDPQERVRHVLTRHGTPLSTAPVPAELAEQVFEIQEAFEDWQEGGVCDAALVRLTDLRADLEARAAEWEARLLELTREHDALDPAERAPLRARLAELVGALSYLRAMRRDLDGRLMAAGV